MSILRLKAVKAETGHKSHASIYTAIKAGLFPTSVLIGQRSVGWPSGEVDAINAARIAGQSDEQIRALVIKLHADRQLGVSASTAARTEGDAIISASTTGVQV